MKTEIGNSTLYLGDYVDILSVLGKVDAVITDPPYGTTANKWDVPFSFSKLFEIQAPVFVMSASQPFTSKAVMANEKWFKHEWIWIKNRGSNFANTVREPMKEHENILVFAPAKWTYNKQMQERSGGGASRVSYPVALKTQSENYGLFCGVEASMLPMLRVPSSWQKFNTEVGLHPTQKPLALFEYLVKTYTNPGDLVIDPFMGSGTTGIACMNLGRRFIGIELEPKYFHIACRRIEDKLYDMTTNNGEAGGNG